MVWKPKEQELTIEEAVVLARKELAPFWFGSSPLLAGVKTDGGVMAFPLAPSFNDHSWAIFCIDPTDFAGKMATIFAREIHRRYTEHNIKVLAVIKPFYPSLRESKPVESILRQYQLPFPVVSDADGLLCAAFRAHEGPKLVLLHKEKMVLERSGTRWFDDTEAEMQKFLRSQDPGLALLPLFQPVVEWFNDILRIEFGRSHGDGEWGVFWSAPGFSLEPHGFGSAFFTAKRPESLKTLSRREGLYIFGRWIQDGDRIITSDPAAELSFMSPSPYASIVAQAVSNGKNPAKLVVELDRTPLLDVFAGQDLSFDDEGQSSVRLDEPRLYQVAAKLPQDKREITFRFPLANRTPVAIYGLRFSDVVRTDSTQLLK